MRGPRPGQQETVIIVLESDTDLKIVRAKETARFRQMTGLVHLLEVVGFAVWVIAVCELSASIG